jgi:hypothetical protein
MVRVGEVVGMGATRCGRSSQQPAASSQQPAASRTLALYPPSAMLSPWCSRTSSGAKYSGVPQTSVRMGGPSSSDLLTSPAVRAARSSKEGEGESSGPCARLALLSPGLSGEGVPELLLRDLLLISGSARCKVCDSPKSASLTESDCDCGLPSPPSSSPEAGPCRTRMFDGLRSQCTTPCE